MRTRAVMLIGVALVAALATGGSVLQAGPAAPEPVIRRQVERIPLLPSNDLSIAREATYQHVKLLGIPPEDLASVMEHLSSEGAQGRVDDAAIRGVSSLAADNEIGDKVAEMLTAYAEMVAFGAPQTYDFMAQGAEPIAAANPPKEYTAEEMDEMALAPATPKIGGTCAACPTIDFGPFAPGPVTTFHSSSALSGNADCAWYGFSVVAGRTYEFATCSPGSATWDTVVEVFDPLRSCAVRLQANDDCQTTPTVIRQSRLIWAADFTGQAHVRVRSFGGGATGPGTSATGPYTLAYTDLGVLCQTCVIPSPAPAATPIAVAQSISDSTDSFCPSRFYSFNLVAGGTYTFTTCTDSCNLASATFDTKLTLTGPGCAALGAAGTNDDACGGAGPATRSTLNYTAAVTGVHVLQVSGRLFTNGRIDTGSFVLCYKRNDLPCANCSVGPYEANLTPMLACQDTGLRTVDACQDDWYIVNLTAGRQYEFTTCSVLGGCTTGGASFDTILDIYTPGCGIANTDDDGCGATRSLLLYTATASGSHRLNVRGKLGATGSYTMTYRELGAPACTPPTSINPWVTTGAVGPSGCSRLETFALGVDPLATPPINYNWSITPAGQASPANGTASSLLVGGATSFQSTLTGDGTYVVTVTASNACGSVTRTQNYTLLDPIPPSITAPANVNVACNAVPAVVNPTATDNCDPNPTVTFNETRTNGPCLDTYTLTRTWTARDRSNNPATATQVIQVSDTTAPTMSGVPGNAVVACNAVPAPAVVTANDAGCDPNPTVTFNEVRTNGSCPGNYTLTRTWTARDRCNNTRSASQTIQVSDSQGPTLTGVPANATVECDAVPAPAAVTATDTCDPSPSVAFSETRVNGSCPGNYTLTRTWTGTDWCGNTTTRTQVLTVQDTTPPTFSASPSQIACLWPPNHSYACFGSAALLAAASVSDNCSLPVTARVTGVTVADSAGDHCGDGNIDPDYEISADGLSVCVQAERCGTDLNSTGGRTYFIEAAAVDACGNESAPVPIGTIFVPHDHRGGLSCQRGDVRRLSP